MGSQLVHFWCRPAMRRPAGRSFVMTTPRTAKSRKPHGHYTKQRRDLVRPPIVDMTPSVAGRADRSRRRIGFGLRGHHDLLHARQKLLRLGQRQTQMCDIAKRATLGDLDHVVTSRQAIGLSLNEPQHPAHQ
jgi:Fe2+ transport system protein FeoA